MIALILAIASTGQVDVDTSQWDESRTVVMRHGSQRTIYSCVWEGTATWQRPLYNSDGKREWIVGWIVPGAHIKLYAYSPSGRQGLFKIPGYPAGWGLVQPH